MSNGVSVYECTSEDEMVDLLQEVFGIKLGRIWRERDGGLAALPAVRAEDSFVAVDPTAPGPPSARMFWPSTACAVPSEPHAGGALIMRGHL